MAFLLASRLDQSDSTRSHAQWRRAWRAITAPARWRARRGTAFTTAYAHSYSHRIPPLYLVACFGLLVLTIRFAGQAPWPLLAVGPILASYAVWRAVYWMPSRARRRTLAALSADIERMGRIGGVSGLLFVTWALALYGYGDMAQRALVHYIVAVTMLAAILGLAHAPQTAVRMAVAFTVPSTLFFISHGHPNAIYIALAQTFLTIVFLFVTHGHHADFVRLELSHQKLAKREQQTSRLAAANFVQASIDPLTGVMNRRAILSRAHEELAREDAAPGWLALVDLDGFKHINDTYGHAAGDDVLRAVATRIGASEGVQAHGRLGGDEFAIIFDGALDEAAVARAARRLSVAIREPIAHNGVTLRLYGSIGVHRVGRESINSCLERADAALYKAKERGDGAIVLFGPDDEIALQRRTAMTRQFNDCALEERLRLLYQPLINIETGSVVAFEAFARWSPDGDTWLAPADFMPMADATRRTGELTRAVLRRALSECPAWRQGVGLGINLAPRDVMREGTVETIADIVREAGAQPQMVTLEVTESALLADPRRASEQLQAWRDLGFRIALDNFGAGWSSLSQLRDLPLDFIKIDHALSRALTSDPGARAIASAIVALAWQLGLDCTIEGIEDEAQVATARALGIRFMQGYHFGRPAPASQALAVLGRAVA